MWSPFVDIDWSLQHPIFRLINERRLMITSFWISMIHEHRYFLLSCASLPGWSNALSRYSSLFWNPIWQYTRYTRVGARTMARIFCDVRSGLWFLSSNEFWYRFSRDGQWLDGQYLRSFLCLKTDLWLENNSSNCPTFSKLLFGVVWLCVWYIYIYIAHVMVTGVCPGLDILQV